MMLFLRAETREIDLPLEQKPEESTPEKQPKASPKVDDAVTPKPVVEPAPAPKTPGQADILNEIAAVASEVQETAKAAMAAANSQKAAEASTSSVAGMKHMPLGAMSMLLASSQPGTGNHVDIMIVMKCVGISRDLRSVHL
jgi:outer membrane biosynthesis protein TonB